jgi:hypothetical protein
MPDLPPRARLPLLVLGMLSLLGGVLAGLARLGWPTPPVAAQAAAFHGPLMIPAFFGTVVSLERAVALGRGWAYLAPFAAGLGGVLLLAGQPPAWAQGLGALAAAVLVLASLQAWRLQPAWHGQVLVLGALCWLAANLYWLAGGDTATASSGWLLFLILTIAGERLELTRFLPTPAVARRHFAGIVVLLVAGGGLAAVDGGRSFALGLLLLAVWLFRHDIARRNLRAHALPRFVAICLLSGYLWLALAGLGGLAGAFGLGHPWRDAVLHALGLGFIFSMVIGHAPIIFPAVMRVRIPWSPLFYLPLALLHLGLLLRVGGVLGGRLPAHAGMLNALTLAVFVLTLLARVRAGR